MDNLINKSKDIEVAVGIIRNLNGQLLVAKRPAHWIGGGFWEFPGGKIEANEDSEAALKRELLEEVGIKVQDCSPLIKITYTYPERKVILNAWWVNLYEGQAVGLEGQEISWRTPHSLNTLNMLPANRPIVVATQLPNCYLITPNCTERNFFLSHLDQILSTKHIKLVQLRSKNLSQDQYASLAQEVAHCCRKHDAFLLLNCDNFELAQEIPNAGIHLRSEQLRQVATRPLPFDRWVGASCHNADELQIAEELGVDFAVLSPVLSSYEGKRALGWKNFESLILQANIPIYGLGGLSASDLDLAKDLGAQGIAAVRSLWDEGSTVNRP